jgi:hypothetical protein
MKYRLAMAMALVGLMMSGGSELNAGTRNGSGIVGTWYLALDTTPYGLPGLALSGLVTFHEDGTMLVVDAGDFGQATFLGTKHSPQFGTWTTVHDRQGCRPGRRVAATTLFLEADLAGELRKWYRIEFDLVVDRSGERVTGEVNIYFLPCGNGIPAPSPLTCPDPIENADLFQLEAPGAIPVTLRRLNAKR